MKYQTATTEQKAGQLATDGTPLPPNPPDDSGEWQLIGLHAFMRYEPTVSVAMSPCEWFVHFYWQRTFIEPSVTVRPPLTPMPGSGQWR